MAQRDLHLRGDEVGRRETEQADAPRLTGKAFRGLAQQLVDRFRLHQRQRHQRQGTGIGDVLGEGGNVGHSRHRPLDDGKFGTMARGDAMPSPERIERDRIGQTPIALRQ